MGEISRFAVLQNIDGSSRIRLSPSQTYCIGRGEQANIRVADNSVSRVHATVFWDGRNWVIIDCSSYGTYINGKVTQKHRLAPGDLVRVSDRFQWEFSEQHIELNAPENEPNQSGGFQADETVFASASLAPPQEQPVIIGTSKSTHALRAHISKTAEGTGAVLIRGELGSGKAHVARAIHAASPLRGRPLVTLQCDDIETSQWNALMSLDRMKGQSSQPGMIVLNRIGKLSRDRQAQLCEYLANLARLAREGQTLARFVCLSTKNLEELVDHGLLLPELLVKIAVVQILIDPLRERREDIPELARHFLRRYAAQFGKTIKDFSADAIAALSSHSWPGNVRELRNVVERAVLLASGTMLTELELQRGIAESSSMAVSTAGLSLEEMEKVHIDATLRSTGWKKSRTALMLGIERSTLDRKIKRYELHRPPKPGRPVRGEAAPASGQ